MGSLEDSPKWDIRDWQDREGFGSHCQCFMEGNCRYYDRIDLRRNELFGRACCHCAEAGRSDVGGQATSYRPGEHIIVQGVSVKNEWPPYRIPAPLSSIVPDSNSPSTSLCQGDVWIYSSQQKILPVVVIVQCWHCPPSCSAVPFPLKSFNYFFCILAALSVERYIPLLE